MPRNSVPQARKGIEFDWNGGPRRRIDGPQDRRIRGLSSICLGGDPSLRAKKYDESQDLWQARVNKDWRFYFLIRDDIYYIVDIIPHPK
jgi:hypothetical protein